MNHFVAAAAAVLAVVSLVAALNAGLDAAKEYGRLVGRVVVLEARIAQHERRMLRLTEVLNKVVDRHNERLSALETRTRP